MNTDRLYKNIIRMNREVIDKTALINCHCIGLNSFVINEKPRMRMFIAEPHCELYGYFHKLNPVIPIHAHKYHDFFVQIKGQITHHLYEVGGDIFFNKYSYARIGDDKQEPVLVGSDTLKYLGGDSHVYELSPSKLHTVSFDKYYPGDETCWVVIETTEDKNFNQVAYHPDLVKKEGLYAPMQNGFDYLKKYFSLD